MVITRKKFKKKYGHNSKKIKNSMVITRGDIERHRTKFTYKMVITCEITALLSAFIEKLRFSSRNLTRYSVHNSTEWNCIDTCYFGNVMLLEMVKYLKNNIFANSPFQNPSFHYNDAGNFKMSFIKPISPWVLE